MFSGPSVYAAQAVPVAAQIWRSATAMEALMKTPAQTWEGIVDKTLTKAGIDMKDILAAVKCQH